MEIDPQFYPNAPVVETILSLQFEPLDELSNGHFGWFWREQLGNDWTRTQDAPALAEQFEIFPGEVPRVLIGGTGDRNVFSLFIGTMTACSSFRIRGWFLIGAGGPRITRDLRNV